MNSNIWTEISNPIRMELLFILFNKKATISELKAKIGDISHSEVSRHIGRLAKQDLITKEAIPGRNYELTNLGKMIVKLIKPLDFILENSEYFKSHRIDDVPEALLQGLQDLSASEIVHGTGNLLIKGKDFMELPNKELWVITNEPFPYEIRAKNVYLIIPPKMLKFGLKVNHETTKYHVHVLSEVHLCMVISDMGQGFIFFPNLENSNPDFNSGFYISDDKGIDYLKSLFTYFWQNSKEFLFDPKSF